MDAKLKESSVVCARPQVAALAHRYCELVDTLVLAGDAFDWAADTEPYLRDIATLLPRLQAAVCSIPCQGRLLGDADSIDLDTRFELFSRLRRLLADRDGYWLEFDRADGDDIDVMTGSLADDLTDIYCELKSGLRLYELDPACATRAWACGFDAHWGRHLVDAERHLAVLQAQGRLGARATFARSP